MPKATPQSLIDEGFRPEQFGRESGDPDFAGIYLAAVVGDAALWCREQVGAGYDAGVSGTYAEVALRQAEVCKAKCILFRRRVAFLDSSANLALQNPQYAERREMIAHAKDACEQADAWIVEARRALGLDATGELPGTGASIGVVESGRYPRAFA